MAHERASSLHYRLNPPSATRQQAIATNCWTANSYVLRGERARHRVLDAKGLGLVVQAHQAERARESRRHLRGQDYRLSGRRRLPYQFAYGCEIPVPLLVGGGILGDEHEFGACEVIVDGQAILRGSVAQVMRRVGIS